MPELLWEVEGAPETKVAFACMRETGHWSAFRCDEHRILLVKRTGERIAGAPAMLASWTPIFEAAETLPLDRWALCLDMRLAPPSQDPAVEGALRQSRERLSSRMTRYAVVLRSAAGVLHATRLLQPAKNPGARIFRDDEGSAMRYLIHGV